MGIFNRIKDSLMHAAFNTFNVEEKNRFQSWGGTQTNFGRSSLSKPRFSTSGDKTITTAIYNQIAMDAAAVDIFHVRLEDDRYKDTIKSGLNNCLTLEANLDQGARAFRQDVFMTMLDKGAAAICITEADNNPAVSMSYDIQSMRVGEVKGWFPDVVRVSLYNEEIGEDVEITLPKRQVAIVENPFFAVMNDSNSILKRLTRKLSILDAIDEQSGSGKLDIIIQLPYVVKSEARKSQAAARRKDMEEQLTNSKYGVAYADATEKITQLNRPAENNMMAQVEFLTTQLYAQLGITKAVFEGTADEKTMKNYHNRTVEPMLTAVTQGMERKFISKTARSQFQAIRFYVDPFKNLSVADMGDLVDTLSRNEIATPNEIRAAIGMRPSKEAKSDKLLNSNMPTPAGEVPAETGAPTEDGESDSVMQSAFDSIDETLDSVFKELGVALDG